MTIQELDQAINRGELALAVRLGESLYRSAPGSQHVALSLSEAYRQSGGTAQAKRVAEQAYRLDSTFLFAQVQYLRCLMPYAEHGSMLEVLQQVAGVDINDPWCLQICSDAAIAIDEWQLAGPFLAQLERCSQGLQKAQAQYMRGVDCQVSGKSDEAVQLFKVASVAPIIAPRAYWSLTSVNSEMMTVAQLEAQLQEASVPEQEKRYLWQALGQVQHAGGNYEQAFSSWQQANKLSHPLHNYSHEAWQVFFKDLQQGVMSAGDFACSDVGVPPVFIVGLPRSGSTLIEQLLVASGKVQALGELRDLEVTVQEVLDRNIRPLPFSIGDEDWSRVAQSNIASRYHEKIASRRLAETTPCDKNPANILWLGVILKAWPDAKILHVQKAPEAACLGVYRQMFAAAAPWSYSLEDIAHYYRHYRELVLFWQQQYPGRILDVQYEEFVQQPAEQGQRIFHYLGLDWDDDVVAGIGQQQATIPTASSSQVRAGVHQKFLHTWQHYKLQLEPFIKAIS